MCTKGLPPYQVPNSSDLNIEIYLASPHQFFLDRQQQFLTNWNSPVTYLVLFLQRSTVSLKQSETKIIREKDRLRTKFIRVGCNLIFTLLDKGYQSDLFDPRTGYPLLSQPEKLTFDDNAAIAALLKYPVVSYQNCSLIEHPVWGNHVYPSTLITAAPQDIIESAIASII